MQPLSLGGCGAVGGGGALPPMRVQFGYNHVNPTHAMCDSATASETARADDAGADRDRIRCG